ncbi:MAG: phosphoribosylformylglycinamidine cyclo-ligase [Candidatus Omnitrophica bacterium]|nr:phosphoribosylformylglycinamidine cyclo-ligase [Candidatus Omnitrophota bacterium]
MAKITYENSGVSIDKADAFVKGIAVKSAVSAFGCIFDCSKTIKKYKNPVLVSSTDGVGTKLIVADILDDHSTIGIDLVAMNVNDIICFGARPLFFLDYIACGRLNIKKLTAVVNGIKKAVFESQCLLIGGETAEMPGIYRGEDYDLAGFAVGIVEKNRIIDGSKIKDKYKVIGVTSSGPHSNGYSLLRKALGPKLIKKHAKEVLEPTRLYVQLVNSLLSTPYCRMKNPVAGIAHVTGGAFYKKATKILPEGLGMVIDKKSWPKLKIFQVIQDLSQSSEKDMYTVFNMGIGLILIVKEEYQDKILRHANKFYESYIIGEVVKSEIPMTLI